MHYLVQSLRTMLWTGKCFLVYLIERDFLSEVGSFFSKLFLPDLCFLLNGHNTSHVM